MTRDWLIPGARRDAQSITADWEFVGKRLIAGVVVREVRHVPTGYGHLTELFRREWKLDDAPVDQVFQSTLEPGAVSAWHAHETTLDRLFVVQGQLRIVLYDARRDSLTNGVVNEFSLGRTRPGLLVIPPKVWHGVQNASAETAALINLVDDAYDYEQPDHWRVPADSPGIPYRFR